MTTTTTTSSGRRTANDLRPGDRVQMFGREVEILTVTRRSRTVTLEVLWVEPHRTQRLSWKVRRSQVM